MATKEYPEVYWAQHAISLSQNQSGQDICGGDARGHARPAKYQYDHFTPSPGPYDLQIGADASGEPRPVGLWAGADNLGSQYAGSDLPKTSSDFEWVWQQQGSAADGAGSAGVLPAAGAASMIRAADNSIPPHQGRIDPNVPLMGLQMQTYDLGYPNRQGKLRVTKGVPPLALGTADAEYCARHSDQGAADMLGRNISPNAHFGGYGASPLEVSEGAGSGQVGTLMNIGYAGDFNESGLSPWAMSTALGGQYGAQQFTGYMQVPQSAQSPYGLQTREYGQQRVMPNLAHGPIVWITQQQSAPATMPADFSISLRAPGTSEYPVPSRHVQAYPSVHSQTHAGGSVMSTVVASTSPPHLPKESLNYTPCNATSVMWTPSRHQTTSATVVNAMGNSTAALPAGTTESAERQMSKTRTGRIASKRCLPGQRFEQNLTKVQERLKVEGADVGAIDRLREIFIDGTITKAALKAEMTLNQRRTREGKQKYMLLLDVLTRPHGSHIEKDHCCLLCPPWARAEFKHREDSLRHFHKDHFGLPFVCSHCNHMFWLDKELAKHVRAKHKQS